MKRLLLLSFFALLPFLCTAQTTMKITETCRTSTEYCFDVELNIPMGLQCLAFVSWTNETRSKNTNPSPTSNKVIFQDIRLPRKEHSYTAYIECGLVKCPGIPFGEGCVVTIEGRD